MTPEQKMLELLGSLVAEMKGMREEIKTLKLQWDPAKLTASTKDPNLPALRVVEPKDPSQPNHVEPWPPGTRMQKPPLVRG